MATSSILGGTHLPEQVTGKDTDALGPSDNSDSGSDAQGAYGEGEMSSDSDAAGTGERASAGSGMDREDADILPDRIEEGLGGGSLPEILPIEVGVEVEDLAGEEEEDEEGESRKPD